jgi:hypothetical protein
MRSTPSGNAERFVSHWERKSSGVGEKSISAVPAHARAGNLHSPFARERARLTDDGGRAVRIVGFALREALEFEAVPFEVDQREGGLTGRGGERSAGMEFEIGGRLASRQRGSDKAGFRNRPASGSPLRRLAKAARAARDHTRMIRLRRAMRSPSGSPETRPGIRPPNQRTRARSWIVLAAPERKSTRVAATSALLLARSASSREAIGSSTQVSTSWR